MEQLLESARMPHRVTAEEEAEGLDTAVHGETGYRFS